MYIEFTFTLFLLLSLSLILIFMILKVERNFLMHIPQVFKF